VKSNNNNDVESETSKEEESSIPGNSSIALNETMSNETKSNSESEIEENSVADVYPYWRATREKPTSKNDKDKKIPYEPRPAKYKENYEDKGFEVF